MRILVVDDDRDFCDQVQKGLSTYGHDVHVAGNVEDANDMVREGRYHAVILDWNLKPKKSAAKDKNPGGGLQVLNHMPRGLPARTVFVSHYLDGLAITEAARAGCRYFVYKDMMYEENAAFYAILRVYIDAIHRTGTFLYRLAVTLGSGALIVVGVALMWFGKGSEAGVIMSAGGVVANVILSLFPARFR
jgi:CheY-like chemotaxis protein